MKGLIQLGEKIRAVGPSRTEVGDGANFNWRVRAGVGGSQGVRDVLRMGCGSDGQAKGGLERSVRKSGR